MNATTMARMSPVRALPPTLKAAAGAFTLPPLPYADDALEPVISSNTLRLHHGQHHRGYVDALNTAVAGTAMVKLSLQQLILATARSPRHTAIFHNAAQAWNHSFYWRSLTPVPLAVPVVLRQAIDASFGSFEAFKTRFMRAAIGVFGCGWAWLVLDGGKLKIMHTGNANNPLIYQMQPLLTLDVWEHAYYIDYQSRRADYVRFLIERLLNWEFAAQNLRACA
jgi:Fe-Mn family superoxide dismutase